MPMNKEIFYGYVPSEIDGTELVIQEDEYKSLPLPAVYSYLSFMSPIMNQGTESTCVPHSISAAYDYYNAMMNPDSTSEGKFTATGISIPDTDSPLSTSAFTSVSLSLCAISAPNSTSTSSQSFVSSHIFS